MEEQKEMQKKKNERTTLQFRRYFLTIPQCAIGKENIEGLLVANETYLSHYMIGEEKHVDGSKHYHIYLKYSKQKDFSYSHFDYLGKHGKLEGCRSPRRSYMYISKEDKEPLCNFDYLGGILSGKPEEIAMYLGQTGKTYSDLFINDKASIHLLATKWRSIKNWENEYGEEKKLAEIRRTKKGIKLIDECLMNEELSSEEVEMIRKDKGLRLIIEHINKVMKYKGNKPFKDKHILIWSKGVDKGKTSLIRKLMEHCPMYGFPTDQWFHGYKSNEFWGIFWNEMTLTGIDVDMLKNFLEGTSVKLAIKGSQVHKEDNPEMFMTSNNNLEEMIEKKCGYQDYDSKKVILNALRARIEEVNVDGYENIFFLSKLIKEL